MSEETQAAATETAAPVIEDGRYGAPDKADLLAAFNGGETETPATEAPAEPAKPEPAKETPAKETPKEAAAAPAEPEEPKIAAIIRAREEAQKKREEGESDRDRMLAEARAEADRIRAEAQADRDRIRAEEGARLRQRINEAPLDTFNEYGVPREKLVDEVAIAGTPQHRAIQEERARRVKLEEKLAAQEAETSEVKKWIDEQRQQAQTAALRAEEQLFITLTSAEKAPALSKLPEDVRLTLAHKKAAEWRHKGIAFATADVAEYLEHQAKQWLGNSTAQEAARAPGDAPKAKANGSRTLSAQSASERRAAPKPYDEIEDEGERKKALLEAFNEGIKSP